MKAHSRSSHWCAVRGAPQGQSPIQRSRDRRDQLSAPASLTLSPIQRRVGLCFRLLEDSLHPGDIVSSVCNVDRHLGRKPIVVADRVSAHRTFERCLARASADWLRVERLPTYALALKPVHQVSNLTEYAHSADFLPQEISHVHQAASRSLRAISGNRALLHSFLRYADINP